MNHWNLQCRLSHTCNAHLHALFAPPQILVDPAVRGLLRFFRGHERAPEGSALAATTGRSTLVCDKQATEEARQKPAHFFNDCCVSGSYLPAYQWRKRWAVENARKPSHSSFPPASLRLHLFPSQKICLCPRNLHGETGCLSMSKHLTYPLFLGFMTFVRHFLFTLTPPP